MTYQDSVPSLPGLKVLCILYQTTRNMSPILLRLRGEELVTLSTWAYNRGEEENAGDLHDKP